MNSLYMRFLYLAGNCAWKRLNRLCKNADAVNLRFLKKVIRENAGTEYGKRYHFSEIDSVRDYRKMVPVSDHHDYEDAIDRMLGQNAADLIGTGIGDLYALSSGTTGKPHYIPVRQDLYRRNILFSMLILVYQFMHDLDKTKIIASNGKVMPLYSLKYYDQPNRSRACSISGYIYHYAFSKTGWISALPPELSFSDRDMDATYLRVLFALCEPDLIAIYGVFANSISDFLRVWSRITCSWSKTSDGAGYQKT